MSIRFNEIITKADWAKIIILVVISTICWIWVWREYQKPVIPPEWDQEWSQTVDIQD
ncbi:MAG: hypothetical protein WC675_04005 [Patescibacteria group bacterium]|jgi:hypothetical protein